MNPTHIKAAEEAIEVLKNMSDIELTAALERCEGSISYALKAIYDSSEELPCICEGNLRLLEFETRGLINKLYTNNGKTYKFIGILNGDDDYYYTMIDQETNAALLLSCVGNIESFNFIPKGGTNMQYILTEDEYQGLKAANALITKTGREELQKFCTRVANEMPIRWTWGDGKITPTPWGCILTEQDEWYCDECPAQKVCPSNRKCYSQ